MDEYSIDRLNNILKNRYTDDELRTMSRNRKIDRVEYELYQIDKYLKRRKYTDDKLKKITPEEKIKLIEKIKNKEREDKSNSNKKMIYIAYPIGLIISLQFVFWSYELHKYWGIFVLLCYMIFFTPCFISNIVIPSSKKNWAPPMGFGAGYPDPIEGKILMDRFCSPWILMYPFYLTIVCLIPINILGTAYKSYTQ